MPVVVADTGPLHYLCLIGQIDLLPRLLGGIAIPEAVRAELCHAQTPQRVRDWIGAASSWLRCVSAAGIAAPDLDPLDDGERQAIELAVSLAADLLLIDDRAGVAAARARGFAVTGTLGLLDLAGRRGLVDLGAAFEALRATNFHVKLALLDQILAASKPA